MEILLNIDIQHLFLFLLIVGLVALFHLLFLAYMTARPPNIERYDSEKYFIDRKTGTKCKFPSIEDKAGLELTVVVPAYNEEERLPIMMDETMEYLAERQKSDPKFTYEVIIVDDGSRDKTTEVALKYSEDHGMEKVRVLTLEKNRGKGGATRLGMLSGRGKLLLFADADGATRFCDIEKLEETIKTINTNGHAIVCGSRSHLEKEAIAERSLFRTFLMKGFHCLVWFFCVRSVRDTQCGFKLFTRDSAALLFPNLHVDRWAFDVDLLYQAEYHNIPIGEKSVRWQEIDGSKVTPFWSWLQMGRDLLLISTRYKLGAWKLTQKLKVQ